MNNYENQIEINWQQSVAMATDKQALKLWILIHYVHLMKPRIVKRLLNKGIKEGNKEKTACCLQSCCNC